MTQYCHGWLRSSGVTLRALLTVAVLCLAAASARAATPAQLEASRAQALAWLITHQQDDGRWTGKGALDVPATAQAVESLRAAGIEGFSSARGLAWLANEEPTSVDSIARKAIALRAAGLDNRLAVDTLIRWRNWWRGWGAYERYNTSFPDTPLAMAAIRQSDRGAEQHGMNDTAMACDVMPNQATGAAANAGGWSYTGWAFTGGLSQAPATAGKTSEVIPTAYTLLEVATQAPLEPPTTTCTENGNTHVFSFSTVMNAGVDWLLTQRRNADGSFGTPSQPRALDTALAYLAISRIRSWESALPAAQDYLLAQQAADGSWQGDAFVTATVLKTLGTSTLADTDRDGVPNAVELILGTNPNVQDSRSYGGRNGQSETGVTAPQTVVTALNQSISVAVGTATGPYTGGVVIGSLPDGMSLNTTTGVISGTPTSAGYYNFTFQYVDAGGVSHSTLIQIMVGEPDTTAPTVVGRSPVPGATGIGTGTNLTASFSEPMNPATLNAGTFELRDASNQLVPAGVTYSAATLTATLTPTSALASSTTYTATLKGGASAPRLEDPAGNALAANVSWSFTTGLGLQCPCTGWDNSALPASDNSGDSTSVTVGVKFRADVNGYITGIRFYKGAGNTGTHTGTLWTTSGQNLGSVTFANETSSGWQQAIFSTPIQVTANTVYVASYSAPNGHVSATLSYFTTSGTTSGPLYFLRDGESGSNSIYAVGNAFPTTGYPGANFWVDVVFDDHAPADTVPPTVVTRTPIASATDVVRTTTVAATFSEAINSGTLSTSTFELRDGANQVVPATVSYNASTLTATLTPSAALSYGTTYTATIKGAPGVPRLEDLAGNALAANASWSFTTEAGPQCPCTGWDNSVVPASDNSGDSTSVTVGVKFRASVNGYVTGIRFYKGAGNTGTHTGTLWTTAGQNLGSVTFVNETASGWQQAIFSTPIQVTANTVYVASYSAPSGHVSANLGYFAASGTTSGPLYFLRDGESGSNSIYAVGNAFPTTGYPGANFWVDVVFHSNLPPQGPQCPCSGWDSSVVPAPDNSGQSTAVTAGVKFRADVDGYVTGIRFYKGSGNTGTHTGNIWTTAGQNLGSVTFVNETASGWQQAIFSTPIQVTANTVYVASYYAPNGHISANLNYFTSSGFTNDPLYFLQDGESGSNSVYAVGAAFPNTGYPGANFWVDVVFEVDQGSFLTNLSITGKSASASVSGISARAARDISGVSSNVSPDGKRVATSDEPIGLEIPAAGLALRLDAATAAEQYADGTPVVRWQDLSGAGSDATASAGHAPVLSTSAIGGRPALRFDGIDDYLSLPTGFQDFTAGVSLYVVMRPSKLQSGFSVLALGNGALEQHMMLGQAGTTEGLQYRTAGSRGETGSLETLDGLVANESALYSVLQESGRPDDVSFAEVARNGTALFGQNLPVPPVLGRQPNYIGKGDRSEGLFEGDIAEIILYNRLLSAAEQEAVTRYLARKYGIVTP